MSDYIERAFQRLRGYCLKKINCDSCRFANKDGDCVLFVTIPADWKIPGESEEDDG